MSQASSSPRPDPTAAPPERAAEVEVEVDEVVVRPRHRHAHAAGPAHRRARQDPAAPGGGGPIGVLPVQHLPAEPARSRRSGARDYAAPRRTRRAGDLRRISPGWRRTYTIVVVGADLLVIAAVGALSPGGWPGAWPGALAGLALPGAVTAVVLAAILVAVFAAARVYEHALIGHGPDELRRAASCGVLLIGGMAVLALAVPFEGARDLALVAVPQAVAAALAVHLAARSVLPALRRRGRCLQRVVAVGLERSVAEFIRSVRQDPAQGFVVVAACVSRSEEQLIEGVPVLGGADQVPPAVVAARADTVALTAWSQVDQDELRRLSWDLEGSRVHLLVAPRLAGVSTPRIRLRTVGGVPLLRVDEPEFTGIRRVGKEAIDYALAALLTLAALPVMVVVAALVRATSPGPVLFRQRRIGRNGVPFTMHKFRSMYVDAEQRLASLSHLNQNDGPLFKLRDDPRVTPVGRVIRRYSLDELPQLCDVLLGRMSLIGPRPPLPAEVAEYAVDVRRRLRVKPGITGLWQVSGRSDLSWQDAVRLDLHYVENWSLGLDLRILVRTARAVLARDGAY